MSWSEYSPIAGGATDLGGGVAYDWARCNRGDDHPGEQHTIHCLYVWHDCPKILGPETVAPGDTFGWRATGVGLHTLVQESPLTITASVYWPECCGLHGFITDGAWRSV